MNDQSYKMMFYVMKAVSQKMNGNQESRACFGVEIVKEQNMDNEKKIKVTVSVFEIQIALIRGKGV